MKKEDLKFKVKDIVSVVISDYTDSNINLYSTQAAFFLIISVVPFTMFLLSLVRFFFPINMDELVNTLNQTIPNSLDYFVGTIIHQVYSYSSISLTSVSALTTLWAASKSNHALSQGLNQIYKTEKTRNMIKLRLSSILNTITLMITMIICLLVLVYGKQIERLLISYLPNFQMFTKLLDIKNILFSTFLSLIICLLYTVLPDKKLQFAHQLPGALFTTYIWLLFSWFYSLYVDNIAKFSITYGVLGTLVLTMMWLQICMNIFLIGAQINVYLHDMKYGFTDH